jgi:hypothetical protein
MPRAARQCRLTTCDRRQVARGYCELHWRRWKALHPDLKVAHVDTILTHVRKAYGPAKFQLCVDCGLEAADWTYDGTDPDDILDSTGHAYSLKVRHYVPRCRRCRVRRDKGISPSPTPPPPAGGVALANVHNEAGELVATIVTPLTLSPETPGQPGAA